MLTLSFLFDVNRGCPDQWTPCMQHGWGHRDCDHICSYKEPCYESKFAEVEYCDIWTGDSIYGGYLDWEYCWGFWGKRCKCKVNIC